MNFNKVRRTALERAILRQKSKTFFAKGLRKKFSILTYIWC